MKRILLISSNVTTDPYPVYPLGMAVISSALSTQGHRVEQFDFLATGESEGLLRERVISFRPDYVCVSIRNLDNCDSLCSTTYPQIARRLVAVVKEESQAPVILGGPAFSIMPEQLLEYVGGDYGIVGEGETLVCDLIRELDSAAAHSTSSPAPGFPTGTSLPRLLRGNRLLDGNEMASPLYSDDLIRFYMERSGMINLQTKRGCPHHCIYCSYPTLEGNSYRCRDAGAVVDDLERIRSEHGVDSFFFTDSIFNDAEGHHISVVEEILRRNLSLRWCCYLRPEGVRRSDLTLMKRAGLYAVEFGTDAASDTTLQALGKGFSFADVVEANDACVAERIPCAHFVMFGGPGETVTTVAEGLANLKRLEHTVVFAFSGIRIFPGTPLLDYALREGVVTEATDLREAVYFLSPHIDAELMNGMISASFKSRRDRVFPPAEGQKRLAIMQRFGYRGLLWDTLIRFPEDDAVAASVATIPR